MPLTEPVSSLGNQAESRDGETYHVPCRRVYDLQLEAEGRGPRNRESSQAALMLLLSLAAWVANWPMGERSPLLHGAAKGKECVSLSL